MPVFTPTVVAAPVLWLRMSTIMCQLGNVEQHVDVSIRSRVLAHQFNSVLVWQFDRRKLARVGGALDNYGLATVRFILGSRRRLVLSLSDDRTLRRCAGKSSPERLDG